MKTPEDEAFDELAKKQGAWGGGFHAKRAAAADKQREWVGLTTEDMATCINEPAWDLILRKAEQILKEKNQ